MRFHNTARVNKLCLMKAKHSITQKKLILIFETSMITVSVFLCYSWHMCKKQQEYVFWGSNSPKNIDEKASCFPAIVEQENSKEAWRRDEGRCLQQSWATQEFCSVAWQQVIICQCAASTCQQPKPTQAASTGKYMRQLTLRVSSTVP